MMEVTYRDFRYFMRLLTKRAQLWTEMVVDDTILYNLEPAKCDRFLGYNPVEHPVVCQLGGCDATKLAEVAQVVERYGYDEINLNVGCPSNKVSNGEFGCSLMKRKDVVRDIVHAMSRRVQIPVTVKCRLGVDEFDSPEFTKDFISTVATGGCKHFQVHARKAWLRGCLVPRIGPYLRCSTRGCWTSAAPSPTCTSASMAGCWTSGKREHF
jgi:tRNA-dihydrouridine synthase A